MLKKHNSIGIICIFIGLLFSSSIIADNQDEELIETNLFSYDSRWEYNDSVEDRCIEIPAISNNIQNILGNPDLIPTDFTIIQNGDWNPIDESIPISIYYKICNYGDATIPEGSSSGNHILYSNGWGNGMGLPFHSDMYPGDCTEWNPTGHKIAYISSEDIGKQIKATLIIDVVNYINESNENNNEMVCFITPYSNQFPVADFNYMPYDPSTQDIIQFIDMSIPGSGAITTWTWDFGDGNSSNIANPTHQYNDNGVYPVTLTVEDCQQYTDAISKFLEVTNEPPIAYIDIIEPNPANNQENISFIGYGVDLDGATISYIWSSNIDGLINTEASFETNELSFGTHNITFKVQDDDGDWSEPVNEILIISENLPPEKPIITGPISGKFGKEYEYTIISSDPEDDDITYSLDWGIGVLLAYGPYNSGEEIKLTNTWNEEGNYTILVKAKDSYGGESDWATLEVSMPKSKMKSFQNGYDNNISIECLSGFGLRIKIVNMGNTTIEFVNISIILDGPFLFIGGGTFNTRTYLEFTPGSIITTGALVFGIGSINVTVYVNDCTKSGSGYLFGPFVIFND